MLLILLSFAARYMLSAKAVIINYTKCFRLEVIKLEVINKNGSLPR